MKSNFLVKLAILLKVVKILKNWPMYLIIYYGLTKNEYAILETRTGLKIKIRTNSTDIMAFTHVWLVEEYSKPDFDIKENDVIFDIGAHIGLFALYASQFCKNGKIYCFEPIKQNFELLLFNIKLNNLKNIIPQNVAVSNETPTVKIFLSSDYSGHSMYLHGRDSIQVPSTTIERIFIENDIIKCDFIKMDCEGSEYTIIDSLPNEYFENISKFIIEYHFADSRPDLLNNLTQKLQSRSFTITSKKLFEDIGFLYVLKKPNSSLFSNNSKSGF